MPAYLPRISRRQFITRSAMLAAVLGSMPRALAARKRTDPDTWAFLSDTHIAGGRAQVVRSVNMGDHLVEAARGILELPREPAGVLVCGDLAYNSGESADYAQLETLLRPIREEVSGIHLLFGNHDNRERFDAALPAARMRQRGGPAGRQVGIVSARRANFFLLDSLETTNSTPGELGTEQIEWLAQELDARKKKPAIILAHHNPGAKASIPGLKDTDALLAVLRPRRQVKAYIFGHTHQWSVTQDTEGSGLHFVNLPSLAYVFKAGQPSAWTLAKLSTGGMRLELRCVGPQNGANGQVTELEWRKS